MNQRFLKRNKRLLCGVEIFLKMLIDASVNCAFSSNFALPDRRLLRFTEQRSDAE